MGMMENRTTAKRFKYRAILKPNCFWGAFRKNPARFLNRFSDMCAGSVSNDPHANFRQDHGKPRNRA